MSPAHWLLMLAVNLVFGLSFVTTKIVVLELPPLTAATLRFAVILLVMLPLLRWQPGQMRVILWVGLLMGSLHFALLNAGLSLAGDISTVAILIQLGVPFSTLFSVWFLGEKIRWRRWLGIALAFAGVMIMGFDPRVFDYRIAVILVVGAAAAGSAGMTLMKARVEMNAFQLQGWVAAVGFPSLLALSLVVEPGGLAQASALSPLAAACLVFTGLGSGLFGHGGTFILLQHYDLSLVSPLLLLATVAGVVFGVTLMGDVLSAKMLIGGLVTLAGALVITLRNPSDDTDMVAAAGAR
ncbi:MAG: DMT family transporter [Pseudomonadota bacterium]